jgi:hypothetical protein
VGDKVREISSVGAAHVHTSYPLLGHHHLDELLVVDLAVTVDVGLADHLIDLLVGELLAEVAVLHLRMQIPEDVSWCFQE